MNQAVAVAPVVPFPEQQLAPIAAFLSYIAVERRLSQNTIDNYASDLAQFERMLPRGLLTAERDDLRRVFAKLQASGIGPSSLMRKISTLRHFYRYLRRRRLRADIPLRNIPLPKRAKRLPKPVGDSDFAKLLSVCCPDTPEGLRDIALLRLLDSCGLRGSEAAHLRLTDLHLGDGYIVVHKGKGDKDRFVPIDGPAVEALREYLSRAWPILCSGENVAAARNLTPEQRSRKAVQARWAKQKASDLSEVFPLTRQRIWQIVRELCNRAGIELLHPHQLRHRLATFLVGHGLELREVADILGHSSTDTTEIYVALDLNYLREVFRKAHPRAVTP